MSLLIRNVQLFNDFSRKADLYLEGGRIAGVGELARADDEIDGEGLIALPGLIDCHVHFREPGFEHKEDWRTGSRAAARGGITTILDMPNTLPPTIDEASLKQKRRLARKSSVNYGFHVALTSNPVLLENTASFKLFMSNTPGVPPIYREEELREVLSKVGSKLVTVHAEDEGCIEGRKKVVGDHDLTRSKDCALTAINKVLKYAKKPYICHVSSREELDLTAGRSFVEVTPQHLFLSKHDLLYGKGKVNPPLRSPEDAAHLRANLDRVDTIATDHAPHTLDEKESEDPPSGMPGVETMLPLLLNEVNSGNLTLERCVELTSTRPSEVFGIRGKGRLEAGFDADIVLIDLKKEHTIKDEDILSKAGWTPFNGFRVKGMPVVTIVGGKVVFNDGGVVKEGCGKEVMFLEG